MALALSGRNYLLNQLDFLCETKQQTAANILLPEKCLCSCFCCLFMCFGTQSHNFSKDFWGVIYNDVLIPGSHMPTSSGLTGEQR